MKNRALFVTIFGLLLLVGHSFAQFNYSSKIDVNCDAAAASCPAGITPGGSAAATWASGIGPGAQIVGGYLDSDGNEHGYAYSSGEFTTIDVPGTLVDLSADTKLQTEVNGINPAGDLVGDYFAPAGAPGAPDCIEDFAPPCQRGFLYRRGQFYNILASGHAGSIASSITPDGSIYGCLHNQTFGLQMFGFERTHSGDFQIQSVPNSMNNAATPDGGIIVGLFTPSGAVRAHGFTVQNGAFTDYMFPGSLATQIWGINPGGNFVGLYRDSATFHGFLQPADGSGPVAIDYNDPVTHAVALQTRALGINPAGVIVGLFVDASGAEHGFTAVRTSTTD
jgi:hypothetical protein